MYVFVTVAVIEVCLAGREESVARLKEFCSSSKLSLEGSVECVYNESLTEDGKEALLVQHGFYGSAAHAVIRSAAREGGTSFYVDCPPRSGMVKDWSSCRQLVLRGNETFPLMIKTHHRDAERAKRTRREANKIRLYQKMKAEAGHFLTPKLVDVDSEDAESINDNFVLMEKIKGTQFYALYNLLRSQMKSTYKQYIMSSRNAIADKETKLLIHRLWSIVKDNFRLTELLLEGVPHHLWAKNITHCDLHLLNIFLLDYDIPNRPDVIQAGT